MQTDTRLIKYIHRAHQRAAKACGKINTLRLATGEGVRKTVESEVSQPHVEQVFQAVAKLHQDALRHRLLVWRKFQIFNKVV